MITKDRKDFIYEVYLYRENHDNQYMFLFDSEIIDLSIKRSESENRYKFLTTNYTYKNEYHLELFYIDEFFEYLIELECQKNLPIIVQINPYIKKTGWLDESYEIVGNITTHTQNNGVSYLKISSDYLSITYSQRAFIENEKYVRCRSAYLRNKKIDLILN